jgi:hypothetical protein
LRLNQCSPSFKKKCGTVDAVVGELEFAWLETKVAIFSGGKLSEENIEILES